ncbi:MAG: lipoate--protein ligase [Christensenellales bacterium]|jgi:lipoate-protein ligase A
MTDGWLLESAAYDPALNLAVEESLLLGGVPNPSLYLWQNSHTVVIGRGQNAWKECRTALLTEEGGTLVRRSTGGGAVYHDMGNLNFSFVMPKHLYDVPRQLDVIRRAVAAFGIHTERSGRNDIVITATGGKFSGNAFRVTGDTALHHGTLLYAVDMDRLGRYLAPSKQKMQAKGVGSVRARVDNLVNHAPGMTIAQLKQVLYEAFKAEYGGGMPVDWQENLDTGTVEQLREKYASWDWTYGRTPRFDILLTHRFLWGEVELMLSLRQGRVHGVQCFSDAMDADLTDRLTAALEGCVFSPQSLSDRLSESGFSEDRDIAAWIRAQEF